MVVIKSDHQYAKFNSQPKFPAIQLSNYKPLLLPDANVDLSTNELNPLPHSTVAAADGSDRVLLLVPAVRFKCSGCGAEPEVHVATPLVVAVAAVPPPPPLIAGVDLECSCCVRIPS